MKYKTAQNVYKNKKKKRKTVQNISKHQKSLNK